ncbi:MAG: PilZ domain-containing protein [Candidatus Aureabacteria bacterium]|nr:PilZ domain-containing protein [Candidatus Auribacterota bacterium]
MKSLGAERRQAERAGCILKTNYHIPGIGAQVGETRNISDGGVLLMVSGDVKQDDLLDLEISLGEGGEPLKTRAHVVYTRREQTPRGIEQLAGLSFLKLSDQQQQAIGKKIWDQILRESTRFGTRGV